VAQTKWTWEQASARDPAWARHLAVEGLPALSTANVRAWLKAVLPVPPLTPQEATELVITHLVKRARSTRSRLKSQVQSEDVSEVLVCYSLRVYESPSNLHSNRVTS